MVRAVDQLEFSRGFGADELLTLHEAACLVGVTVTELRSRIEDGPIEARIRTEDGVRYPALTRAELVRHFSDRYPSIGVAVEPEAPTQDGPDTAALLAELDALRHELAEARAEIRGVTARLAEAEPELYARSTVQVEALRDRFVGDTVVRWVYPLAPSPLRPAAAGPVEDDG